jgi:hypothetical protein
MKLIDVIAASRFVMADDPPPSIQRFMPSQGRSTRHYRVYDYPTREFFSGPPLQLLTM